MTDESPPADDLAPVPAGTRFGAGPVAHPVGFAFGAIAFGAGLFTAGLPSVPAPPLFRRSLLPARIGTRESQ